MRISLSTKVAFGTFVTAGIGIFVVAFLSYTEISQYFKQNIVNSLRYELSDDIRVIDKNLDDVKKDVSLLLLNKRIPAIKRAQENKYGYDAQTNETLTNLKEELAETFKSVLDHSEAYFNIRLIGRDGKEIVVVLKDKDGNSKIQKEEALQNKSSRNYFKEAIQLSKDNFYISKINLNREHGEFSIPYIPTIRLAKAIYIDNKIYAILIINANVNELFTPLQNHGSLEKKIFLANEDGYYLYNKDADKTFGFDLGHEYKITDDFNLSQESYFKDGIAFVHKKYYITNKRYVEVALTTSDTYLQEQSNTYKGSLALYIFIATLLIATTTMILVRYLISPIIKLTKKAHEIASTQISDTSELEEIDTNDEIGELSHSLVLMIHKIENSKKEIEKKVEERTQELNMLNENLESLVSKKTSENIKQLEVLQQQTKMASMGEMIGAIAHQWRQPLNEISISIQNLKYDYEDGLVDEEFVNTFIEKNKEIIKFMSTTIDDFRNFYRVDKEKELFDVKDAIEKTLSLQMGQLVNNNINVKIEGESFYVNGFKNEFQQVVLNIVNNAKDALLVNKIQNAQIMIRLKDKMVSISDNAGGIEKDIIERIFEPYYTTKEQGKGTGMGLYMSKMIIEENMQAQLSVRNTVDGAEFIMDFHEK